MPNTTPPSIALNSGYAGHYAGSIYTATPGVWTGGATTANWQSNGVNIAGATGTTYTLTSAIEGTSLTYKETQTATGLTATSNALQRPALTPLIVDSAIHTMSSSSRPALRTPFTDPVFGTRITRITGDSGTLINSSLNATAAWGSLKRHVYSRHQPWNADESLFWIETNSGSGAYGGNIFLNGQTYVPELLGSRPSGWVEGLWHDTDPNLMIYVTDNSINRWNVRTGVTTLLHSWSGTYNSMTLGNFGGEQSRDSDIWPIAANRVGTDNHYVVFAYKISTDSVLGLVDLTALAHAGIDANPSNTGPRDIENYVSYNGTYMLVYFTDETSSLYNITGATGTLVRHRWAVSDQQRPSHGGMGIDLDGTTEVIYGRNAGSGSGRQSKTVLSTDVSTGFSPNAFSYHTCARTNARWVSSDFWPDSDNANHIFVNEVGITSKTGTVYGRLCHIHKGTFIGYSNETHTCISPSGKRVAFKSSWQSATETPVDVYISDFRGFYLPGIEGPVSFTVTGSSMTASVGTVSVSAGAGADSIISLNAGYAGHYAGSVYTATPGTWASGGVTGQWKADGANIGGATGTTYTLSAANEGKAIKYTETSIISGLTRDSNTLTRPALVPLIFDAVTHTMPTTASKPAYLSPYTDPTFGTRITRITDDPGTTITGFSGRTWGSDVRHPNGAFNAWNCDESLIFIETNTGGTAGDIFLNGQTYVPVYSRARQSGQIEARWHDTLPNQMNYITSTQFRSHNISADTTALIHDFTGSYTLLSIGNFQGEQSRDGDIWPFIATRTSDTHTVAMAYKVSTDTILGVVDLTALGKSVLQASISALGTYLFLYFSDATETAAVYTTAGVLVSNWTEGQKPANGAMAQDNDSSEIYVGSWRGTGGTGNIIKRKLSTGVSTVINPTSFGYSTSASNHGTNNNNWVATSYYADSDNANHIYVNEAVCPIMLGTNRGRICHLQMGLVVDTANAPYVSMSPSGKRVIFKSGWRSATSLPVNVFIADWRGFYMPGVEGAISFTPLGASATASVGTVSTIGKARVTVTGPAMTASVGTVGQATSVNPTGQSVTASVGSVTVVGKAVVSVTGNVSTAAVSSVLVTPPATTAFVTGNAMTASVGNLALGDVFVTVDGLNINCDVDTIDPNAGANVLVDGLAMACAMNGVVFTSWPPGLTVSVGNVYVKGWQRITTPHVIWTPIEDLLI